MTNLPLLQQLRSKTPLVQAITNYVTINDCANILLALGASPAMCESQKEAYDFSKIAQAVYLNIGILTQEQEAAMPKALLGANEAGVPVILDPVACGALPGRKVYVTHLNSIGNFAVIKGNYGEIKALAGMQSEMRGVDSLDGEEAMSETCMLLAQQWKCIVIASGATDVISDGNTVKKISGGSALFSKITGAGCMLGAVVAGFCGATNNYFDAAIAACTTMKKAGELAEAAPNGNLPGSFKVNLMNAIDQL